MSGEVFAEPPTVEAEEQQAVKEEAAEQPTEQQQQQEPSITSVWNGYRLHVYQWKPTGTPKWAIAEYMLPLHLYSVIHSIFFSTTQLPGTSWGPFCVVHFSHYEAGFVPEEVM